MENLPLVVGSLECPIQAVASIIGEDEKIINNWSSFARGLGVPNAGVKKLQKDLLLDKIRYSDMIYDVLEQWVGLKGSEAKLVALILVIEEECQAVGIGESLRLHFNFPTTVHDTLLWENLTEALQAKVLETVHKLVPNLELEDIKPLLNGLVLQQLLKGITDTLPECLSYYVNRKVLTRNIITPAIFEKSSSHIFLISGIENYELSKLAKDKITDHSSNQIGQGNLTVKHMMLDSPHHFQKICKMTTEPIHMFSFEDNKLRWLQSRGGLSAVQDCIGSSQDVIPEEDFISNFDSDSNQHVCIVDSPGMGKSVFLAQIGRRLVEIYPDRTIIFLGIGQLIQKIRDIGIVDHLQKILHNSTSDDSLISIELLLDGFDEMDTSDMTLAQELLKTIRTRCKSIRMWVTSRPQLLHELEQSLDTIGFNIQPFSVDDQVRFLTSYWAPISRSIKHPEKLTSFASHCLQTLESTMNSKDCDVAGVPLQCLLIAEVYEEDAVAYANTEQSDLPIILIRSVANLYESLIDWKFQKSGLTKTKELMEMHVSLSLELLFPEQFAKFREFFRPVEIQEILKVGLLQASNSSTGLIFVHRTVAEYFVAWFVVRMLQEDIDKLWFAQFLFQDMLHTYVTSKKPDDYYTSKRIKCYEFSHKVIAYFADSLIPNIHIIPYHITLQIKNIGDFHSNLKQLVWSCVSSSHSQILKFLTKINAFEKCAPEIFELQLLFHAIRKSSLEIVKFILLQFEDHHQYDVGIQSRSLNVAVKTGEFSIVEYLIKEKQHKHIVEQLNDKTRELLHICVEDTENKFPSQIDNRIQVIRMLTDINPSLIEIQDVVKRTPLFLNQVHIKLKAELISLGACALKVPKFKYAVPVLHFNGVWYQPIDAESFDADFRRVLLSIPDKVLKKAVRVKHGISNQTPLHNYIEYFDIPPATLDTFQNVGADFNCVDKDGYSLLATAVVRGRSAVTIRKLIEAGADVHYKKGWRRISLLHVAAKYRTALPETMAVLMEWIDWNVNDLTMNTPMDYAKIYKRVNRFKKALDLAGKVY